MENFSSFNTFKNNFILAKYYYYKQYKRVIMELKNTGIPIEYEGLETKALKFKTLAFFSLIGPIIFMYKIKYFGLINKTIISLLVSGMLTYYFSNLKNKEIVEDLIKADNQIGHEARILIKYFIPDHSQLNLINLRLEEFRDLVRKGETKKNENKNNMQRLISEEEKKDEEFKKKLRSKLL